MMSSARVWDGEKLRDWSFPINPSFFPIMRSTTILNQYGETQIYDGDLVEYNNERYYVDHDENYLDYPEGSEFTIISVDNKKSYAVQKNWPTVKVVGNMFDGTTKIRSLKFLREYKLLLINRIPIPIPGLPELDQINSETSVRRSEKIKQREILHRKLDAFRVDSLPGSIAEMLDRWGVLNVGVCCPLCGVVPITKNEGWAYRWIWANGIGLNICERCFKEESGNFK